MCGDNFCLIDFNSGEPMLIVFVPGDPADQVLQVVPRNKEHQRTGRSNQVSKLKKTRNFSPNQKIIRCSLSRILPEIVRQRRGFGADKRGKATSYHLKT